MIKIVFIITLIICSSLAIASNDHNKAKRLLDSGEILPLETIIKKVRAIQAGKILEVEFETEHGQKIYEIELLKSDGKVIELKMDATSGEHLSTEIEN